MTVDLDRVSIFSAVKALDVPTLPVPVPAARPAQASPCGCNELLQVLMRALLDQDRRLTRLQEEIRAQRS